MVTKEQASKVLWGDEKLHGTDAVGTYGASHLIRADHVNALNTLRLSWDQNKRDLSLAILVDVFGEDADQHMPFFPGRTAQEVLASGRSLAATLSLS